MKQLKKGLLILVCALSFASLTACGNNNADNGAVKQEDETPNNATQDNTAQDNTMNDATDGTRDEGVLDEAGDAVRDGADDMAEEVKEGMEDIKK